MPPNRRWCGGSAVFARRKEDSLLEDWREELQPAIRGGRHFLEQYGRFMDEGDRIELQEALEQGDKALVDNNEESGSQAAKLISNKVYGSGTASLLLLAEQALSEASARDAQGPGTGRRQAPRSARQWEQVGDGEDRHGDPTDSAPHLREPQQAPGHRWSH